MSNPLGAMGIHRVTVFGCLIAMGSCAAVTDMGSEQNPEAFMPNERVQIEYGDFALELAPRNGGSVSAFTYQELDIMRPAPDGPHDIVGVASFPLVPIVNRIPDGAFEFEGTKVQLDGNFLGLPDLIHGHGWRGEWMVTEQTESSITLSFDHEAGAWPWSYQSTQVFQLLDSGLRMELSVTNLSDRAMPAALGFHPYFPTTPETTLTAKYDGHWVNNELGHVLHRVEGSYRQDFTKGAGLVDPVMTDQTHYGWSGPAVLSEPGRPTVTITASPEITNLHVFFPPNGSYTAIEPTAGRGDPFGTDPIEYRVLQPGETYSIWMQVDVG